MLRITENKVNLVDIMIDYRPLGLTKRTLIQTAMLTLLEDKEKTRDFLNALKPKMNTDEVYQTWRQFYSIQTVGISLPLPNRGTELNTTESVVDFIETMFNTYVSAAAGVSMGDVTHSVAEDLSALFRIYVTYQGALDMLDEQTSRITLCPVRSISYGNGSLNFTDINELYARWGLPEFEENPDINSDLYLKFVSRWVVVVKELLDARGINSFESLKQLKGAN